MPQHAIPIESSQFASGRSRRVRKRSKARALARALRYHVLRLSRMLGEFFAAAGPLS